MTTTALSAPRYTRISTASAQLLQIAKESLEKQESVTVEEYAKMKNIPIDYAREIDLNGDGKISKEEEASRVCAQYLFKDAITPTMILCRLHNLLGFDSKRQQVEILQNNGNLNVSA